MIRWKISVQTVEYCPCFVAINTPEEIQTTCVCERGCGPQDETTTETTTDEPQTSENNETICACARNKEPSNVCTTERMSVYCQYYATTSLSGNTKITCLCSRDKASSELAMCWSAVKSTAEKSEVLCECERVVPGISIIGRPPSPPILISDASNEDIKVTTTSTKKCSPLNCSLSKGTSSTCSDPGLSMLICRNLSTCCDKNNPSIPHICSDINTPHLCPALKCHQTCSVLSPKRSYLKIDGAPQMHKSVKIQMPELRSRSQECLTMTGNDQNEGHCNIEECIQQVEEKDPSLTSSICQTIKNAVNIASSGIFKDSSGACSLMDSATGSCDANAQASYYHNKLVSTQQILQNREETIRVQAESLAVAEERISVLTERGAELRRDLDRKTKEIQVLRQALECCKEKEKVDVSVTAKRDSEIERQSDMMNTLQNNLGVIEELYRECFYETAKQEDLIDMLRNSYLDVRLMEKQKADQIGRLQNVINTQKLSLDRCQEIALEVDTLKMEISNFLSSSASTNNDSGMWERSEESFASAPEVHEELQEVMEQLLRLRELLSEPCTCGLQNEIRRLKQKNEALERQSTELFERNCELEKMMQASDEAKDTLEQKYKEEMKSKEEQLNCIRRELAIVVEGSRNQTIAFEQLSTQLRQTEELLGDKSEELVRVQQHCGTQQETIDELKEQSKRAEDLYKENYKLCGEAVSLREQLAASERRARKLDARLRHTLLAYSEKESNASEVQAQLEEAHARGAALCGDARRVLAAIRRWARRATDARREQENIIKEKDVLIAALQDRLRSRAGSSTRCVCIDTADELPCSSSRRASCSRLEAERPQFVVASENKMASCSSAPTPPRRQYRKKTPCGTRTCRGTRWFCDESQQLPERQDAFQDPMESYCEVPESSAPSAVTLGNVSPTEELLGRMEQLSEALADGYRRWNKSNTR